jgi:hypothetical protein
MRELSFDEILEVSGGARSLAVGLAVNAIWDAVGGLEGIASMLSSADDYLTDKAMSMGETILANPYTHGYMD